jgi:putative solute:sodium symporter small subunit
MSNGGFSARALYWRHSLILAGGLLGTLAVTAMILTFGETEFNTYSFFGFPLGFYALAQGLILLIAGGAFWYARVQDRLDEQVSESEEF